MNALMRWMNSWQVGICEPEMRERDVEYGAAARVGKRLMDAAILLLALGGLIYVVLVFEGVFVQWMQ